MSRTPPDDLPRGEQLSARDDTFRSDPYAVLAPLRQRAPVYHDPLAGRYVITRHDHVKALLANRDLHVDPRKANPGTYAAKMIEAAGGVWELSMIDLDAPEHRRVRRLVSKAFTVTAVEALRQKTRALAEQLLDAVREPEFDLMPAFADPLPTTVIAEMLGIDPARRDEFKAWSTLTIERFDPANTPERLAEIVDGEQGLRDVLFREIARRRAHSANDLIGRLVEATEGGEQLTDAEIVAQCQLLLVAGNTTTSDLIGNGVKNLLHHPEQLADLRAHPDALANAVEEILRFDPSVDCTRRIANTDLDVGGCPIKKGEYLYLSIASANRDETVHTEADRFDIRRPAIRHAAFGGGDHLCLGAPLARLEGQEALRALLARFPRLALSPRGFRYRAVPNFRGLKSLWLAVAMLAVVLFGARVEAAPKVVEATPRGDAAVRIDGKLDEPIWASARAGSDFARRFPADGTPAQPTTFKVLYDATAVYFGIASTLAPGSRPRVTNLKRDAIIRFWFDDNVQVKLDVEHGKQNLLLFGVNADGVQLDAMELNNGRQFVIEWDAQWSSASHIDGNVWTVEIKIPANELGGLSRLGTMGINVVRNDMFLAETMSWSPIPQALPLEHTPLYGELRGTDVGARTPLIAEAYVLGAAPGLPDTLNNPSDGFGGKAGFDVRTRLGATTFLEGSVLTDFAQVDLDSQQLNLDRFALFLPEKRDFFLAGFDVFNFGRAGVAQPLFTRRIGVDDDGDIQPVWGGLKAFRRGDRLSFGVVDVVTAETADAPLTHWAAARARMRIGEATSIGALGTAKQPIEGAAPANYTAGADLESRFTERARLAAFGAVSGAPGEMAAGPGVLSGAELGIAGDLVQPALRWLYVSRDYDSQTGFVARTDVSTWDASLPVRYHLENPQIRALELAVSGDVTTNASLGQLETAGVGGTISVETTGSLKPFVAWKSLYDVVRADFALSPELMVTAGEYRSVTGTVGVASVFPSMVLFDASYSATSGFFGGERHALTQSLSAPLGKHVLIAESATAAWVELAGERALLYAINGELDLRASRRLGLELLATYDSVANAFQGLGRLKWNPSAASTVYLVYREQRAAIDERSLVLKLSSQFNLL